MDWTVVFCPAADGLFLAFDHCNHSQTPKQGCDYVSQPISRLEPTMIQGQ